MTTATPASRTMKRQRELVNSVLSNHEAMYGKWLAELSVKISEDPRFRALNDQVHLCDKEI